MTDKELEKLRKKFENYDYWRKVACNEALNFVRMNKCRECHGPVVHGYCCNICGSTNP